MSGKLYLIATPIGNLEDITLRALRILKEADIIAAEDTRRTLKLLNHFEIHTPMTSYYEQNKTKKTPYLLKLLAEGKDIAVVSDAGTPGISDPGSELVEKALMENFEVVPIPGPVAFVSALIASGLNTERFIFLGFLPRRDKDFRIEAQRLTNEEKTVIIYESPHRVLQTLKVLAEIFPQRKLVAARELTKVHEEFVRGNTVEVYEYFRLNAPKGEFCLVLGGAPKPATRNVEDVMLEAEAFFQQEIKSGTTKKDALKKTAKKYGLSKNVLYEKFMI